jgi:eukaryotic-like serine/threonine-protein kinase
VALTVGTQLGPYEITAPIGAGGMGEVYKATDTRLDRTVAIKILPAALADNTDARVRFEREARAVAALNHPHICALYDVGPNYLVMEMVDGQPLAGPLTLDRALLFATQILSALEATHSRGITHRDLKPGNILVTGEGVKLLDFGLAKVGAQAGAWATGRDLASASSESPTATQTLTHEHTILGTVQYMSPEQVQGKAVDARSDLFSFGLVLYEMLTGRRAFDGANPASVIASILGRDAPSVATIAPRALDRVLQKCLAKDPRERWQTARDIRHALDLIADTPALTGRARSRWGTLSVAALAGFLAAGVLGAAVWRTWPRSSDARARPLTFHVSPPAGAEFQSSAVSGGSALSPDGRSIVFVAVTDGIPRLWIRPLDSLNARELVDTEGARLPFWSADGRSLGFFASGDLRRIDVGGGAATVLARAPDPRGGAWNADGTIVFSPAGSGPLQRVSASGGTPTTLTRLVEGETNHRWPQFLPDGRTLQYFSFGRNNGIWLTRLDQPDNAKRVFDTQSQAIFFSHPVLRRGYFLRVVRDHVVAQAFDVQSGELTGSPVSLPGTEDVSSFSGPGRSSVTVSSDGTLLYGTGGSRYQLTWLRPDGTTMGTVGAVDQFVGLRLSPDAHEAIVTIRDPALSGDLWRIDLKRGTRTRLTSQNSGWFAVWSPDGQQIALSSQGGRDMQIVSARGAGEARSLPSSNVPVYPSDWSRDGRYLAYTENAPSTSNDVWLLPMARPGKAVPFAQSPFTEFHGGFSPDGSWLAFTSNEAGREDVYIQNSSDAGTRRLVSIAGGSYPRWGPGGRDLWYRAADGRLMRVPVRMAGSSIELGTPTATLRLTDPPGVHPYPYDVAPDGRILALVPATEGTQQLTVLMNWQAVLEP